MDQFTQYMQHINTYLENPFGILAVCTAPIILYYAVKIYIAPLFKGKEHVEEEQK